MFLVDARGRLRTPSLEAVLPGITRMSVVEIAKHEGVPVYEGVVELAELTGASEAFLASSVGVWPVASVDKKPLPTPAPGKISARLKARFDRAVSGADPDFAAWLTLAGESK